VGATSSAIRNHRETSTFLELTRAEVSKILTATGDVQDTAASEFEDHGKLPRDRLPVVQHHRSRQGLDRDYAEYRGSFPGGAGHVFKRARIDESGAAAGADVHTASRTG
jgi:hypothetical protein